MINLGPYTLLRRIGTGGMGEVWIARRSAIGGAAKLVAIKTVLPEKARNEESRRMFLDEARLSMLMTNSNIVQVFDVDETPTGLCYMAMEYVDGIDLARLCEYLHAANEQLSHAAIAYIIGEILKALAYAHDLNVEGTRRTIVHRDISPQNVMLSVSGEVKVMDFGIARLSSEDTSGMFVKGKLRYMPPEQFERGVRAATLDLFAVGAILHELLDGHRFRGGDHEQAELLGMCIRGGVPPLTCAPGRVPPVFEQLRKGLLEPVAANRIQSARAAHRLLSSWPGDRDAKFELEEIVRRFVGESSLTAEVISGAADPEKTPAATLIGALPPEPVPAMATTKKAVPSTVVEAECEAPISNDEMTDDRRIGEISDTQADIHGSSVAPPSTGSGRARWLIGAIAGAAGLAVFGLGFAIDWPTDEPEQAIIEDAPAHSQPKLEPPAKSVIVEAEPTPTLDVAPGPQPKLEPKSKQDTKTAVTIRAAGVWAQVKIGPKKYTFDRLQGSKQVTAKIAPGAYAISYRDDPGAAWQPLGKVRVPARGPITIDIKGGKFTVGK